MATGSSKVASPNTELGEKDLAELLRVLYPARNRCIPFGLQVGLEVDEIESIENRYQNADDRLRAILIARIRKSEALTWNDIDAALRVECVGLGSTADNIQKQYPHLFTPTVSIVSEHERGTQVLFKREIEKKVKDHQCYEGICKQGAVSRRQKRTQSLRMHESESEQEHEIKQEEIKQVKMIDPGMQKGAEQQARVSKEREGSSEDEGIETVRSKKHVQEVESEDEEDGVLSRKEKKEEVRRKGAHYQYKEVHDKERPIGKNKKERFMKHESQSEPEEVVREKSKRKKKATHDKEESVKGYGDRDHYSDTEVCEKVRKMSKKHSKKRKVYTESESEASSDEDEMENSSFEDDTSHKGSARKKLTNHKEARVHLQKEHRKNGKKNGAKSRDIQFSDEDVSTKSAQKFRKLKKVETESEEESSSASSSDEEEIEVHKSTKKSKHTETKSTKDTSHYESEEKGKTSGKKRVLLKPKSATAKEGSHYPEEYKDKGRKKAVRVDERVGKSTDSSRETYHKARSKPPRKETEGRDGKREVVSATAPPSERELPSSEMPQTDSGDGESYESSEDESVQNPKRLNIYHDRDKHSSKRKIVYVKGSVGWKGKSPRTAGVKRSLKTKAKRPYGTQRGGNESKDVRSVQSQAPFSGYESNQKIPSHPQPKQKLKAECASEHLLSSEEEMPSSSLVLSRPSKTSSVLGGIEMSTEMSDSESSSREQEEPDTPEERRRRKRIRETGDTPLASDPSSYPTSGNETRRKYDNSEWQRMISKHARYHRRGRERHRERVRQEGSSSSSDSADSSPECDRKLSESERRKLRKLFKCAFGRLCRDITNPADVAAELQAKRLLSRSTTASILSSPDSRQAKAIFLVRALARRIKPRPDRVFTAIEVFCSSEGLQDIGREMKIKAGKSPFIL